MNLAYLFAGVSSKNLQMLLAEAAIVFAGGAAGCYGLGRYACPVIRAPGTGRRARGSRREERGPAAGRSGLS